MNLFTSKFVFRIILFSAFHSLNVYTIAYAAPQAITDSDLKPGQCYSVPDSKNYLASIKAQPTQYSALINKIGQNQFEKLTDSPEKKYYFCSVRCRGLDNSVEALTMTLFDDPNRTDQMSAFSCHGVDIENVQIVGSVYGLQPVAYPFYSYDTNFPELQTWLKENKFKLTKEESNRRIAEMKNTLQYVGKSYLNSSSPQLQNAGAVLYELVLPDHTLSSKFVDILNQLKKVNWQVTVDFTNPDFYVLNTVQIHGRFLEYSELD